MSFFDNPLINGCAVSWADIALRLTPEGAPLLELGDIQAVNFATNVEVGEQREGGRVTNITRGSSSEEASIVVYASGWQKIMTGFLPAAPRRGNQAIIGLVRFSMNVQWSPPTGGGLAGQAIGAVAGALGVGAGIHETRIKGARIIGRSVSASEGSDAQLVELTLKVIQTCDVVAGTEIVLV